MTGLKSAGLLLTLALPAVSSSRSATPLQNTPTAVPTLVGCFSSHQSLIKQDTYKYQSSGYCWGVCSALSRMVLGLANGSSCWCGDELPSADSKVPESQCSTPCPGYDLEDCGGGTEYFTIWLTGIESSVPHFDSPSNSHSAVPANTAPPKISASSNPSSSKTTSNDNPLATTTPGSTPTSSSPTSSKADENSQRRKPDNKRPVILGVVLGLTAFTAFVMMALIFWCLWRRRRGTGRFFRHGNASSLSNEPLRPDGEAESITASSTYSAEQWGPGWEEQTANTLDAMQSALNSNTRNHSGPIASDHVAAPPPSEQRSNSRLLSTELEAREYRNDNTLQHARELPTPFSPTTSMQSPRPNTLQPNFKQSASISITVSADESTGPVSPPTAKKTRKQSRSLIVHYPSGSEVDGFDFCGSGENPLVGKRKRESWHPSRERRDGRYELA